MKNLETTELRISVTSTLAVKIAALEVAIERAAANVNKVVLTTIKNDFVKEKEYLDSKKEWLFNFVEGGWNSVYAKDKEEAISIAAEEFGDTKCKVDIKTFRISTKEDYNNEMNKFN